MDFFFFDFIKIMIVVYHNLSRCTYSRGGFSGIFPDSSLDAYKLTLHAGLPTTILRCDMQLTSDKVGICFSELILDSGSDISRLFSKSKKSYLVNETQGNFYRPSQSNQNLFQVVTVSDMVRQLKPPRLWLNIQHNLSMRSFVISASQSVIVNYISSPDVNFLRSIFTQFKASPTKLIFQFGGQNDTEPSTNQTYASLLKNLTFIKTFSYGILDLYMETHTSAVLDAHKEGLEIYYLNFIENDNFSVDGVLSDFRITPSEVIVAKCVSYVGKNLNGPATPLVISHEGASGHYPSCSDLSYKQVVLDGKKIISELDGNGIISFGLNWSDIQNLKLEKTSMKLNGIGLQTPPRLPGPLLGPGP
ncbi:hypothetical protein DCAR_0311053 [Daucus carota subsp. sativus]|uniref:glycerophosphodiester phosphodiesterase n=1 Tax=Daucus carota subsp. sativus TaxID=79200 RepID=A0AAF1ATI2_DAUCS|nr:hypothetical protein DCAR_0311053 [Daucus carota subsp. sativus]